MILSSGCWTGLLAADELSRAERTAEADAARYRAWGAFYAGCTVEPVAQLCMLDDSTTN